MKRPSTYYAPICAWLQEQQKTKALDGLTYKQIAERAEAALNMSVCSSSIDTLARQLGYKYRTLKQPDLLEDKSPTDSNRIKQLMTEQAIIKDQVKIVITEARRQNMILVAICHKLGIEVPK